MMELGVTCSPHLCGDSLWGPRREHCSLCYRAGVGAGGQAGIPEPAAASLIPLAKVSWKRNSITNSVQPEILDCLRL